MITRLTILAITLLLLVGTVAAQGNQYVSIKGDFYFTYDQQWNQIDHRLIDHFLRLNNAGSNTLNYEAAFCPIGNDPFWSGPYLFMTVETDRVYTDSEIDSVLTALGGSFGTGVKYFPVSDFIADLKSNTPTYDQDNKTITIASDIVEHENIVKKQLLVMKYFDNGLTTFYFFAPDSLFDQNKKVLVNALESFTVGGIDSVLPKESLEVVDLSDPKHPKSHSDSDNTFPVAVGAGLVAVLVVLMARRKKRKRT